MRHPIIGAIDGRPCRIGWDSTRARAEEIADAAQRVGLPGSKLRRLERAEIENLVALGGRVLNWITNEGGSHRVSHRDAWFSWFLNRLNLCRRLARRARGECQACGQPNPYAALCESCKDVRRPERDAAARRRRLKRGTQPLRGESAVLPRASALLIEDDFPTRIDAHVARMRKAHPSFKIGRKEALRSLIHKALKAEEQKGTRQ